MCTAPRWCLFESSLSTEAVDQFAYRPSLTHLFDKLPPKLVIIGEVGGARVPAYAASAHISIGRGRAPRVNRNLHAIQNAKFTNGSDSCLVMELYVRYISRIQDCIVRTGFGMESLLGSVYEGGKDAAGMAHGRGLVRYVDGRRFEGTFDGGKKHGAGIFYSPTGHATLARYDADARVGEGLRLSADRTRGWRLVDGHPKAWAPMEELSAAAVRRGRRSLAAPPDCPLWLSPRYVPPYLCVLSTSCIVPR